MQRAESRRKLAWLCLAVAASCQAKPSTVPLGGEDPAPEATRIAEKADAEESAEPEPSAAPKAKAKAKAKAEPAPASSTESTTAEAEPPPSEACEGEEPKAGSTECGDDKAELGDCSALRRPVEACVAALPMTEYCNVANQLLRPSVARSYYDCVERHSGTEALCAPKLQQDCFIESTKVSCSHASFEKQCTMLARDCPSTPAFFRKNCEAALRAIRDDRLEEFSRCLARCDLAACVVLDSAKRPNAR